MTSDSYEEARRQLELAVVGYYWQLNPLLERESKEKMVHNVVKSALNRVI